MTQSQASTCKILIVDDTPGNLTALTHLLSRRGYQVWQAITEQEALKAAQNTRPDLILLDIIDWDRWV
jgi:CheY-like chemotaxis protein